MKTPSSQKVVFLFIGALLLTFITFCSSSDFEEGDSEGELNFENKEGSDDGEVNLLTTTEQTSTSEPELSNVQPEVQPQHDKNKNKDDEPDDDDDNSDGDDDEEDESPTCDVKFFLDKIIPEDYYPHQHPTLNNDGTMSINSRIGSVPHLNDTIERINRLHHFSTTLASNLTPFLRQLASHLSDLLYEAQLPFECMGAFMQLLTAVSEQKTWALGCKFLLKIFK